MIICATQYYYIAPGEILSISRGGHFKLNKQSLINICKDTLCVEGITVTHAT